MDTILVLLLLIVLVGMFRPYKFISGSKRWHYGLASAIIFIAIGVVAPSVEQQGVGAGDDADFLQVAAAPEADESARCNRLGDMAWVMSRRFVERALAAPATAQFPSSDRTDGVHVERTGQCTYLVQGWVDSQNGFGAMLRSHYSIEMESDERGANWRGRNLNFR